ncbi:MAG: bifunctional phosphoribosylaminoimidazolecarboxamide formyltransferase/IMP cyclohydrolase [Acidobacteriota bacterium]|nr:bifunctional phosphoribosylaminoimidazolecarboxamide formyltransferase/IMP cyclohydrolase [Acidobacteriota bacterium]
MRRAILSVSDKSGLIQFGKALAERGFELVSTGGTAKALAEAGLPVVNVSDVTGFPEMMDGRVKTLHPKIHGGILARRHHPEDLQLAAQHGIGLVDLVVVNLYPFVETAAKPGIQFDDLIEQIDIGGPSLVRAAAKNFRDVLIVVSPKDYDEVIAELDRAGGPSIAFCFELARRAFSHTGSYDTAIAGTLAEVTVEGDTFSREQALKPSSPQDLLIHAHKLRDLRYGENPHQLAAWYSLDPPAGLGAPAILQGKELSFTNLLDLDAAARIVLEFDEPAAAVIKHTNPCGVATGASIAEAYVRARDADSLAAFGGIIGLNRPIDEATARAIVSTFIEAVVAPSVASDTARAVLATKTNLRVVTADFTPFTQTSGDKPFLSAEAPRAKAEGLSIGREYRSILGALLVQQRDQVIEAHLPWPTDSLKVVTRRQPTELEWQAMRFAWRVMAHVKSNTVIFTDAVRTLAIGAGQMSRVDAVKVATMKAGQSVSLKGSVAASDAFFPFRDGLDAVAIAGATAVVQPGGSVKDAEVIAAADEHGLAMVFTGRRHFRH